MRENDNMMNEIIKIPKPKPPPEGEGNWISQEYLM